MVWKNTLSDLDQILRKKRSAMIDAMVVCQKGRDPENEIIYELILKCYSLVDEKRTRLSNIAIGYAADQQEAKIKGKEICVALNENYPFVRKRVY